jgi:hypothetical protein
MMAMTSAVGLRPHDVRTAADWVGAVLQLVPDDRWTVSVANAWSPRRTLDHVVDVMVLYSGYIATSATARIAAPRNGDPAATPLELIAALHTTSSILTTVLDAMPDDARAFHPSGEADRTGWIAMACTELLVHGHDIAIATRVEAPRPDDRLADAVVERSLPWTASGHPGWARLLWATGRAALGRQPPQGSDWWWHSAPLSEWDGQVCRRSAPPQW